MADQAHPFGMDAMRRTLSGRVPSGPARGPLSTNPLVDNATIHLLVVLSATNPNDTWLFANFMAFCKFFDRHGVSCTYLSCFPIQKAFDILEKNGQDAIKFGFITGDPTCKGPPILRFTRAALERKEHFFQTIAPQDLKKEVNKWVDKKCDRAKSGHIVNMCFEGHGHETYGYSCGLGADGGITYISKDEFGQWQSRFDPAVQVNAFMGCCYSGNFIRDLRGLNQVNRYVSVACGAHEEAWSVLHSDQYRGGCWEVAIVQSFCDITQTGIRPVSHRIASTRMPKTVLEHEQFIRNYFQQNTAQLGARDQHPDFYLSANLTTKDRARVLDEAIENLLFKDRINILYDPTMSARRRRRELPDLLSPEFRREQLVAGGMPADTPEENQVLHENFIRAFPDCRAACQELVTQELGHMDLDPTKAFISDYGFSSIQKRPGCLCDNEELDSAIITLYFRSRVQEGFLNVFEMLLQRSYIGLDCLRYGLGESMKETAVIRHYLLCMSHVSDACRNRPAEIGEGSYDVIHMAQWLATMIQRSWQGDLNLVMEMIVQSGFLGEFSHADLEEIHSQHSAEEYTITRNPECNSDMSAKSKLMVGWILPHNAGNVTDTKLLTMIADAYLQADRIEMVYKKYFNLSDDVLLTADQQATYFEMQKASPVTAASSPLHRKLSREFANEVARGVYSETPAAALKSHYRHGSATGSIDWTKDTMMGGVDIDE